MRCTLHRKLQVLFVVYAYGMQEIYNVYKHILTIATTILYYNWLKFKALLFWKPYTEHDLPKSIDVNPTFSPQSIMCDLTRLATWRPGSPLWSARGSGSEPCGIHLAGLRRVLCGHCLDRSPSCLQKGRPSIEGSPQYKKDHQRQPSNMCSYPHRCQTNNI